MENISRVGNASTVKVSNEVTNFGRFDSDPKLPQAIFLDWSLKNRNVK